MITPVKAKQKICLVAGNGELPALLGQSLINKGFDLTIFAVTKEAYKNLKKMAPIHQYTPADIFKCLEKLQELDIKQATFIGKVPKMDFLKNLHRVEPRLFKRIQELKDTHDDSLHDLVAALTGEYGVEIVPQNKYLKDFFPQEQVFTKRQPSQEELEDIRYGIKLAKEIARLDIGQTIVVSDKSPIAIEAIEGTDECIKRAKKIAKKKQIIVCKVSKPDQDSRFDIPAIGLRTLKTAGKGSIIAFEAGETFLLDQEETIKFADKNDVCVLAI